ncbi:MAG TPA: hypothetical protein VIU15_38410 [Streptomyces sp.]
MPSFRSRLITISAVRWTEDMPASELIAFTNGLVQINDVDRVFRVYDRLLDEWMPFEYGDWIVCGLPGVFYRCGPDLFDAMYEPVTGSGTGDPVNELADGGL